MAHATAATCLPSPEVETEMLRHIIDVYVLEELKSSECSIYKVPCNIRKVNEEAYTPQLISIGPIHLDKVELKPMQEHKLRYFHFFWKRVSDERKMRNYNEYLQYLKSNEQEIRQSYADKFHDMSKDRFVSMALLDSVFIMELLLRNSSWKSDTSEHEHDHVATRSFRRNHGDDHILTRPWLSRNIARDLILLENQIPFFVLDRLYESVPENCKKHTTFVDLALEYFAFYDSQRPSSVEAKKIIDRKESRKNTNNFSGSVGGSQKPNKDKDRSINKVGCKNPKHFTDLIRYFYLPNTDFGQSGCPEMVLRTASKLQESGITFEKHLKRRLLDITFDKKPILSSFICFGCLPYLSHFKARFRIPQLKVDHTTECVLRNLIAFEQCYYPDQPRICNYVSLIDSLIHTKVDVDILVEEEVIVHELGSDEEVAALVNGLCKHVVANTTCYYEIINKLNSHYQNAWNRTMAALWLVYFRDPWRASSTVVGIAVLIFAVFNFLKVLRYFN